MYMSCMLLFLVSANAQLHDKCVNKYIHIYKYMYVLVFFLFGSCSFVCYVNASFRKEIIEELIPS